MGSAVRFMHHRVGVSELVALQMASLFPAQCIGVADNYGHLSSGAYANFAHFHANLNINQVWQNRKKSSWAIEVYFTIFKREAL